MASYQSQRFHAPQREFKAFLYRRASVSCPKPVTHRTHDTCHSTAGHHTAQAVSLQGFSGPHFAQGLPESSPGGLPMVAGATVHSFSGHQGIFLSRPLGGPKPALSRPTAAAPSNLPRVPPGPCHVSSPGPAPPRPAQPGPNRHTCSQPPCQLGSCGSPLALRDRCRPILEAPMSLRTGAAPCAGALCKQAGVGSASPCWPSEALQQLPWTRWWMPCGPWYTSLSLSVPGSKPGL